MAVGCDGSRLTFEFDGFGKERNIRNLLIKRRCDDIALHVLEQRIA
jgi:hypothetical protein